MQRERIADDIYVFISDRYAQVTATVIQTRKSVTLFDTLLCTLMIFLASLEALLKLYGEIMLRGTGKG